MNLQKKYGYYLLGFAIFLALLFLFDRGLFYTLRGVEKGFYKKQGMKKVFWKRRDFNKDFLELPKDTYSTLIMGSSRTHRGIHPLYFQRQLNQNAFKIAKAKIRIKFNYYFYQEYKKIAGTPKVVIYGLDYFMFRLKSHEFFMDAVTGGEKAKDNIDNGPLLLLSNKKKLDDFLNDWLEDNNQFLQGVFNKDKEFRIIDPFIGYPVKELMDPKKPAKFKKVEYTPYPGEEGIYFTKLLEEWNKDGVKVILVYLPDFIGTHSTNFQRRKFVRDIRRITKQYKNVFIYNYNKPKKFPLSNPHYFIDGDYGKTNSHLSLEGSRVFHERLFKDIKKHY